MPDRPSSPSLKSLALPALTLVGALIWLQPELTAAILWLGALIIVPLGWRLSWRERGPRLLGPLPFVVGLVGAGVLTASWAFPAGPTAAALALPWLLVTAAVALSAAGRALNRKGTGSLRALWDPAEISIEAGLGFLVVGGGWTFLARAGVRPMGFSDVIVLLTGVHFHYAGFALPILTGLAARRVPGRHALVAVIAVIAGLPLVAIGLSTGLAVEVPAALFMAASGLISAVLQTRAAGDFRSPVARVLALISAAGLVAGMVFAAIYALGLVTSFRPLTIANMAPIHGLTNALLYACLGLLAWTLEAGREAS